MFASLGLHKQLLRAITTAGFEQPRPIQARTIPAALQGRDVLGLAQTGTGKTAAFALPILERLLAGKGPHPRALILAPTRELAIQIQAEFDRLARFTQVKSTTIIGGIAASQQVRAMRQRPHVIVACPGRLLDLMGSGDVRLNGVEVLVLDEADHMFDMGFLPDIKRILARLPERRQNLLFSATMPKEIRALADQVLRDPHVVEIAHDKPLETIEHALYPVEQGRKPGLLRHLLRGTDFTSAIVFLRTKHRAKRLARQLDDEGFRATALQGNMSQSQRQKAMQGFRKGIYDVLVATDIAARGIDVAGVSHVINFDVPGTPEAYTHRIGRTGRAEMRGRACTFFTREDTGAIKDIERKLKMSIPRVKLDHFKDTADDTSLPEPRAPRSSRPPRPPRADRPARQGRGGRDERPPRGRPERDGPREPHPGAPGENGTRATTKRPPGRGNKPGARSAARPGAKASGTKSRRGRPGANPSARSESRGGQQTRRRSRSR